MLSVPLLSFKLSSKGRGLLMSYNEAVKEIKRPRGDDKVSSSLFTLLAVVEPEGATDSSEDSMKTSMILFNFRPKTKVTLDSIIIVLIIAA